MSSFLPPSVQLKDVQGHQYAVQNVHVKFSEPLSEPVPESKLRLDLGNRVKNTPANGQEGTGNTSITPWYEVYRDTFLDHLKQSDHETIKHYVSCEFNNVVEEIAKILLRSHAVMYRLLKY